MPDPGGTLAISLLNVAVALGVAYGLYRLIAPRRRSRGPLDTARRVSAIGCGIAILALLPKLFHARDAVQAGEAYALLIIGVLTWGALAFGLGWAFGKLFLKYRDRASEGRGGGEDGR